MDDVWFQKLLVPMLDNIPPPILVSILNSWYESKTVTDRTLLKSVFITESEADLLDFIWCHAIHPIIAGEKAAVVPLQKDYGGNINVFIPVYGTLDKYFVPTLQNMILNAKRDTASHCSQVEELLEFSHNIITRQTENQTLDHCTQQKIEEKHTGRRSISTTIKKIDVIWIEVPIVKSSLFTKLVPLRALFIFYLLAGTFEMVTSRIAILDWEDDFIKEEAYYYRVLRVNEMLHLIYRLHDYQNWMILPNCNYYRILYQNPHEDLQKTNLHQYNLRKARFKRSCKRISKYRDYCFPGLNRIDRYPKYCVSPLTNLCLSILVSLSDLFWVKYKQNFPDSSYQLFKNAKDEMIKQQQLV